MSELMLTAVNKGRSLSDEEITELEAWVARV